MSNLINIIIFVTISFILVLTLLMTGPLRPGVHFVNPNLNLEWGSHIPLLHLLTLIDKHAFLI